MPQGSVLRPLLFIIYVNDIRQQCSCSTITLYADDTALQPKKSANEILFQSDIDNIGLYLSDNKLTLNVEKTINLNFGFKTMMNVLRLNNATLKKSNEVKYLSVLLDNKLDFKKHINSIAAKLTKFTGLFYKLRFILSINQLVLVYKSFVQPVIQYGVLIYGTASKTSLKFIEVKIKQISRIIFRKQSHQSTAK